MLLLRLQRADECARAARLVCMLLSLHLRIICVAGSTRRRVCEDVQLCSHQVCPQMQLLVSRN